MKKWSRLTALMLAFVIMFSTVSGALAAVEVDYEALMQWIQSVKDAHGLGGVIQLIRGGEVLFEPVPFEPTTVGPQYTQKGTVALSAYSEEDEIPVLVAELERHGKIDLVAPAAGQWKVFVPAANAWINVNGETGSTFAVTMAKLQSMFADNDTVVLCCMLNETQMTEIVAVTVSDTVTELTAAVNEKPANTKMKAVAPSTAAYAANTPVVTAEGDAPAIHNVTVQFLFENGDMVATPYTATVGNGQSYTASFDLPSIMGYEPDLERFPEELKYNAATDTTAASFTFKLGSVERDYNLVITYIPALVDYTVYHYVQNVNNDEYTLYHEETKQGYTESYVPEVALVYVNENEETVVVDREHFPEFEGFYSLPYVKPQIAADGDTYVEIYYDRNYYLMLFELNGGYGTEPVYGRYGAQVSVANPEKTGYTFGGWSPAVPGTIPLGGGTYTAQWTNAQMVNYSVVYWREKADSEEFEFWGSEIKQAVAGSTVSGSDSVPTSISNAMINGETVNEKPYFTYNDGRTSKNVVIEGDGSSVINVYYNRNYYTIVFTGYGKCALEEHEHNANCGEPSCFLEEHDHEESGCTSSITCGQVEHTAHTDECLICNEPDHTHTAICYITDYSRNGRCRDNHSNNNAADGTTSSHQYGRYTLTCVKYGDNWYYYDMDNSVNTNTCNAHKHSASCYKDALHTHTDNCITYSCGKENHTHSSGCYQDCPEMLHKHTNVCYTNNNNNVIYIITAKYQQTIGDIWPTYDVLKDGEYAYENSSGNVVSQNGNIFRGWNIDGVSAEAVSKRINMTNDLCDTSDGIKNATALYSASYTNRLYYMFESFDQTTQTTSDTRKYRDGKYYDSDPIYYQELNSNSETFGQKDILGMTKKGVVSNSSNGYYNNWLYYDRVRSTLRFQNVAIVEKTVSNIMYGQPLADYTADGVKLSEYVLTDDQYPVADLVGLYKFDGWYTTPECYEGTEFNFATATMPLTNLTLYAHWVPINHRVRIYLTVADADKETNQIGDTLDAPHGYKLSAEDRPATPTNGGLNFVGWFYKTEEGEEKAFDFNNMAVTRDMDVYAKWSSNILKQYYVYYQLEDGTDIAPFTTGSELLGNTVFFEAKGGEDVYEPYRNSGYFPDTVSHSITMDVDDAKNTFTFVYKKGDPVPYTVRYLEKDTNVELRTPKYVADNMRAVVTENFVVINGYMPDAYQKRLVIDATEGAVNEIIFYYTRDELHAYYRTSHYLEPLTEQDPELWEEYTSTEAVGDIGKTYTAEQLPSMEGFVFAESMTEYNKLSGVLTQEGLHLKLYYIRKLYPYTVRYLEEGTGKVLKEQKTAEGKYGWRYIEEAPIIENYTLVSETSQQSLVIKAVASANVITFYYKEQEAVINYVPVFGENEKVMDENDLQTIGSLNRTSENLPIINGVALGSTATLAKDAAPTYKFVGWFSDPDCENENLITTDPTFKPTREEGALWEAATFYAKFDWNVADLTITKDGLTATNGTDSAIFKVTGYTADSAAEKTWYVSLANNGTAVIKDLQITKPYTVTEMENWSVYYEKTEAESGTIQAGENKVSFTNKPLTDKWLHDESYEVNFDD